MSKAKTDAAVLREAAKIIEDGQCWDPGEGSCTAIAQALANGDRDGYWDHPLIERYIAIFKPQESCYTTYWARYWIDDVFTYDAQQQQQMRDCRTLALCFAAAMAETGDL